MTGRAHLFVALAMLAVVAVIVRLLRRGQLRGKYALLWIGVGALLIPLAAFPDVVTWVARAVGVYYEPTILIFGMLGFLMLVTMHYSWELSRLEERARVLAEEIGLLRAEIDGLSTDSGRDDHAVGDEGGEAPDEPFNSDDSARR